MKKTFTINISGVIFHIDEDAYQELRHYLDNLRRHFSPMDDYQEILDDIECRIAEILKERLGESRQVISMEDIHEVIRIMGKPSEIEGEEEKEKPGEVLSEGSGTKRFFRDPEDKVIAGVCSGIAAYFHIDPVIIRLIFILFALAVGTGVLIYIILWVVIPEAKTTSDKLMMRGEKVTIANIERSFNEELNSLKEQLGKMTDDTRQTLLRTGKSSRTIFENIAKVIGKIVRVTFKTLGILFGIVIAFIGVSLLIAFLAVLFGWGGSLAVEGDVNILAFPSIVKVLLGCDVNLAFLQITLLFILGIPLVMLLYNGVWLIFRFKKIPHLGLSMFNLWIIGLIFTAFYTLRIYNLYKYRENAEQKFRMERPAADTIRIGFINDDPLLKYMDHEVYALVDGFNCFPTEEKNLALIPKISLHRTDDSIYEITRIISANGKTISEARKRIKQLSYPLNLTGSSLLVSPFFILPREECWRGQEVNIHIGIPDGKYVQLDPRLKDHHLNHYFFMGSSADSVLRMTESGLEVTVPVIDTTVKK